MIQLIINLLGFILLFAMPSYAAEIKQKKVKIPKTQVINNYQELRSKNIKKMAHKANTTLSFRSSDFRGKYYIGGEVQTYTSGLSQRLLNRLIERFPEDQLLHQLRKDINVYVVYDRSLNAHATRNNNIFLTSQWIIDAQSEGEVATVLAHELAHLILKHPNTVAKRESQLKSVKRFTELASIITVLSGMRYKTENNKLITSTTKSSAQELMQTLLVGHLMQDVKQHYINTKISRKHENQADFFAVDMIDTAGYPTESAPEMLKLLQADEAHNDENILLIESYLDLIQPAFEIWAQQELIKLAGDDTLKIIVAGIVAKHISQFANNIGGWIRDKRRNHLKAEVRYHKVNKYVDNYYSDDSPPTKPNDFPHIKKQVETVYRKFKQVEIANQLIDLQRYHEAQATLNKINLNHSALDLPVKQMQWIVRSKLRIAQGRFNDVLENICKFILNIPIPTCHSQDIIRVSKNKLFHIPQEVFTLLAEAYIHLEQYPQAHGIIDQGTEYFTDDMPFQIHKTMIGCKTQNLEQFTTALKQCLQSGYDGQINCHAISKRLEIMQEKATQKAQRKNKYAPTVKWQTQAWWEACDVVKKPFSNVKTPKQKEVINSELKALIENISPNNESTKTQAKK